MSAVAGRMSIQAGAHSLEKNQKGRGLLLGGAPGAQPGNVLILGGGVVGENAAIIATGIQAVVSIIDKSPQRLKELHSKFGDAIIPLQSDEIDLQEHIKNCDLLIGGVLVPGANAPKLVSKEMISSMKRGAVIVDVAIDQGGCVETSKPTTHANPTYVVGEVVHYCVTNMPGAVPLTATEALNKVTLSYVENLADNGIQNALDSDEHLRNGLNILDGRIVHPGVKEALE
jgi:alanine dehydrogenase